jgi:RNA polymerase sigma-70 factor (ECF subfamily)
MGGQEGFSLRKKTPAYPLFTVIKNKCLDYLRHQTILNQAVNAVQEEFQLDLKMRFDSLKIFDNDVLTAETSIEELITKAIDALPEKCREIFIKSKLEGKKQKEIAEELNISINTIETQMGIAYKKLKSELKDYLPIFIFCFDIF